MKDFMQSLTPLEIATLVVFVIYIIFPFQTPGVLAGVVNTPIGIMIFFLVALYLFFYTSPVLGVIFIFVAYELIRRTSLVGIAASDNYMIRSSPSEMQKAAEMNSMNPVRSSTLEEDVISKLAPAQVFHRDPAIETGFKPMQERLKQASLYK